MGPRDMGLGGRGHGKLCAPHVTQTDDVGFRSAIISVGFRSAIISAGFRSAITSAGFRSAIISAGWIGHNK